MSDHESAKTPVLSVTDLTVEYPAKRRTAP